MSIKEPELVPETGIELYSAAKWNRGTIADGSWLQNNTMKPLYENELILASAVHDVSGAIEVDILTCSSKLQAEVEYLSGAHDNLVDELGDISGSIQHEIDTINAGSDVIDVVGTHEQLMEYSGWTTKNDVIKVLNDSNYDDEQTYYRWTGDDTMDPSTSANLWEFVGGVSPYYSKQDINEYSAANKSYVDQKFTSTSAWVNSKFTDTSAWVNQRFIDTSGYIDNRFDTTSAYINTVSGYLQSEISSTSSTLAESAASLKGSIQYVSGQLVYSADLLEQKIKSKSSITYLPTSANYEEVEEAYLAGNEVILVDSANGNSLYRMTFAGTDLDLPVFTFLKWPYRQEINTGNEVASSYLYKQIIKGQAPSNSEHWMATKYAVDQKEDKLPEHGIDQLNKYLCVGTNGKLGWMNVPAPVEYSAGNGLSLQNHVFTNTAPNVKADWNATAGSSSEILNKPTIPTVNDGTLTIQKNGSTIKTFTANSSTNVTANITVPTKTSELTNDSNFATTSDVKNGKLTIQQNGTSVATFAANQASDVSANITVPTTDTTYDPTSTNPQAGTAVSGAIATKQDKLPNYLSNGSLTVNSNGTGLTWAYKTLVNQIKQDGGQIRVTPVTSVQASIIDGQIQFDGDIAGYFVKTPNAASDTGKVLTVSGDGKPVWADPGTQIPPFDTGDALKVLALNSAGTAPVWSGDYKRRSSYDQAFTTSQQIIKSGTEISYLYIENDHRRICIGINTNGKVVLQEEGTSAGASGKDYAPTNRTQIISSDGTGDNTTYEFNGLAASATKDSSGKTISSYYKSKNGDNDFTESQKIEKSDTAATTLTLTNSKRSVRLGMLSSSSDGWQLAEMAGKSKSPSANTAVIESDGTGNSTTYKFRGTSDDSDKWHGYGLVLGILPTPGTNQISFI